MISSAIIEKHIFPTNVYIFLTKAYLSCQSVRSLQKSIFCLLGAYVSAQINDVSGQIFVNSRMNSFNLYC